jgi:thiopeptide-type bacteriocin biosynthesis protein
MSATATREIVPANIKSILMNYKFFSSLLVRTPLYSFHQYKGMDLSLLLQNEQFRRALFLASKTFFDELEKKQFDFDRLTEKQKLTIRKYINRACFRSTPFGLFSATSLVEWTNDPRSKIILSKEPGASVKLDFSVTVRLWEKFLRDQIPQASKFQSNQSLYFTRSDIRYVKAEIQNDQTLFSMVSIARNPLLKKLLAFCKKEKTWDEILCFLVNHTGAEQQTAEDFMAELISQQILCSDRGPNITGCDYPESVLQALGIKNSPQGLQQLSALASELSARLCPHQPSNFFYAIAERNVEKGGLPLIYQQQIMEGLNCLAAFSQSNPPPDLDKFKSAFKEKYDSSEVPLLEALDSQLGVGYGDFANMKNNFSFLSDNHNESGSSHGHAGTKQNDLSAMLLNQWHLKKDQASVSEIVISDEHIKKMAVTQEKTKVPPSISMMFRISGGNIFIEHAGGCSALSLIGRFSFSRDVYEFGREISRQEQNANRNIVFAEIAHLCDLHSANINRRKHLREYEIPVLTHSIMEPGGQIHLGDIMVSVINDTVILRSKKLRKTIIPRLSSAYNYTKNSFPVFRFLCDIQNQHLKTDFSLSLSSLVPGLKFYPRIRYKSCILQVAEWHFSAAELDFLQYAETAGDIDKFREFARARGLPRYFAYCFFDNFLVFDLNDTDDLVFFLKEIKNKEAVVLKEFPFIDERLTENSLHRPLLAQYVASLFLEEEVYKPQATYRKEARIYGSAKNTNDWLYFKIYCHPISSDNILCDHILPLLKKLEKKGFIQRGFWVRYQDPRYHLRLRMKPGPGKYGTCFEIFSSCFNKLRAARLIHHFQTDIYVREIDRYSAELIPCVEAIFNSSSKMVGKLLKMKHSLQWNEETIFTKAVSNVREILLYFNFSPRQKIEFSKLQFEQFFDEFGRPKNLKNEFEKIYKSIHSGICLKFTGKKTSYFSRHLKLDIETLIKQFDSKKPKGIKIEKLAADIIHMHLNRLFSYEQRYFEMMVYYLLYRARATEMHRQQAICL